MHKDLRPTKIDGSYRWRQPLAPKPASHKTKRANGRVVANGNTVHGRRLRELLRSFSEGFTAPLDEQTAGLIRSAARLAVEAERLEDAAGRGEVIDCLALVRLTNGRERALRRLDELRQRAAGLPASSPQRPGPGGWSSDLRRELHRLAWTCRAANVPSYADLSPAEISALHEDYAEREARGEFAADAK